MTMPTDSEYILAGASTQFLELWRLLALETLDHFADTDTPRERIELEGQLAYVEAELEMRKRNAKP